MDDDMDWYEKLAARIHDENVERFPKPAKWNRKGCEKSTEIFARYRLHYFAEMADEIDPERKLFNPILDYFVKEYPLPIGLGAISECYSRNGWDDGPREIIPSPFVERLEAYAGLAIRFESENTVGWFLGLVQPYNFYTMPENDREELSSGEVFYWSHNTDFVFVEGMILMEGKPDQTIIDQLIDFEKYYRRNILGKKFGGRPRIDPTAKMYAAREIVKANPEISQQKLTELLDIPDISTFKKYRKAAGFPSYQDFKDSVTKA